MTLNRRDFVKGVAAVPILSASSISIDSSRELVNDVHTGLNPTWVDRVVRPTSIVEIQNVIHECHRQNKALSVSGSRHAAGGQQFAERSTLLDMRGFNRVVGLDNATGILQVESGIEWPELLRGYLALQTQQPEIVTAEGKVERCDRKKNRELFTLAIGGYGLFGIITTVGLRLAQRIKLKRRVEKRTLAELLPLIEKRAKSGVPYGYFQYSIDETSDEFMRAGVLTTYEPVADATAIDSETKDIDPELLADLLELAHLDRGAAYRKYAALELARDGEIEWSDLHQLSSYPAGYHKKIENHRGAELAGADLILEVYLPRQELISFVENARYRLLKSGMPLVYGTIRFIERDKESFLAWAKQSYACVIFTTHVAGGNSEMQRARDICRHLEQAATKRGGSFYLTYNRFATRSQLDAAYPQFSDFLMLKKKYDPSEMFQSEWYRYYQQLSK